VVFGVMPKEGELLTCETWTSPHKRSQANREFALTDEHGVVLARAASRWVLMNTSRRRPAKLDPDFFGKYSFENGRVCADEDHTIDFPDDSEMISTYSIPVMRRDTDTNKHANNAVYIDWALDGVPDDIYDGCRIKELTVLYKKECRRGDQVRSTLYKNGNDILCVLADDNDPEKEFGHLLMTWE
jgi:medium-chain acyl-[acyl-carrier-protein] hydrolase